MFSKENGLLVEFDMMLLLLGVVPHRMQACRE